MQSDKLVRGYVNTPNGQIHYVEKGDGPPLLLLSESPRTHRQFQRLIPLLSPHFRIIAPDYPGYGNSDAPPLPVTVNGITKCIVDFLDALGLEQVNIFGIHTGNKVGACLAANWPKMVNKVVLAGHTHSIIPELGTRNAAIQPILDTYLSSYGKNRDGSHLVRDWAVANSNVSSYWWTSKLLYANIIEETDVEDAESRVIDYLLGWRNTVAMYKAVFAFDLADAYKKISAPTLILELDTAQEMHYGPQAEGIALMMQNAIAMHIQSSYLAAPQEQPNEIVDVILPFLKGA